MEDDTNPFRQARDHLGLLAGLVSDYFVFFTLMMAICLLGLLPTLVLVLALQKFVVRGLVAGALKG